MSSIFHTMPSLFKNKTNIFYVIAFAPLIIILYFTPFDTLIPLYGFLLLLLKRERLQSQNQSQVNIFQRALGVTIMVSSFFAYYLLILVFPDVNFYGAANYVVYLLGLFLTFFKFSALREYFTPAFLIVAATSIYFVDKRLKPYLSPYASNFAHIIEGILRTLGMNISIYHLGDVAILKLHTLSGSIIDAAFVYECIGVYSALVFSIILVVVLLEESERVSTKLLWAIIGIAGTFSLNVIRVTIILLTDYFYGAEAGANVHYVIGYILFSAWLVFFLYVFSKRQTISTRVKSIMRRF